MSAWLLLASQVPQGQTENTAEIPLSAAGCSASQSYNPANVNMGH